MDLGLKGSQEHTQCCSGLGSVGAEWVVGAQVSPKDTSTSTDGVIV